MDSALPPGNPQQKAGFDYLRLRLPFHFFNTMETPATDCIRLLRNTDIYLIDQILKERFHPGMKLLDAGCGEGRNLEYFMQSGYPVYGIDKNENFISYLRQRSGLPETEAEAHFRTETVEQMSFDNESFDVVISNAVLHFAKDDNHFRAMLAEMWRVLKPEGMFFCRLATSIGIEKRIEHIEGRHYLLPDGTRRYLADETMLLRLTHQYGASFLEPIKTVNVQNARCMTTWVLKKVKV